MDEPELLVSTRRLPQQLRYLRRWAKRTTPTNRTTRTTRTTCTTSTTRTTLTRTTCTSRTSRTTRHACCLTPNCKILLVLWEWSYHLSNIFSLSPPLLTGAIETLQLQTQVLVKEQLFD